MSSDLILQTLNEGKETTDTPRILDNLRLGSSEISHDFSYLGISEFFSKFIERYPEVIVDRRTLTPKMSTDLLVMISQYAIFIIMCFSRGWKLESFNSENVHFPIKHNNPTFSQVAEYVISMVSMVGLQSRVYRGVRGRLFDQDYIANEFKGGALGKAKPVTELHLKEGAKPWYEDDFVILFANASGILTRAAINKASTMSNIQFNMETQITLFNTNKASQNGHYGSSFACVVVPYSNTMTPIRNNDYSMVITQRGCMAIQVQAHHRIATGATSQERALSERSQEDSKRDGTVFLEIRRKIPLRLGIHFALVPQSRTMNAVMSQDGLEFPINVAHRLSSYVDDSFDGVSSGFFNRKAIGYKQNGACYDQISVGSRQQTLYDVIKAHNGRNITSYQMGVRASLILDLLLTINPSNLNDEQEVSRAKQMTASLYADMEKSTAHWKEIAQNRSEALRAAAERRELRRGNYDNRENPLDREEIEKRRNDTQASIANRFRAVSRNLR